MTNHDRLFSTAIKVCNLKPRNKIAAFFHLDLAVSYNKPAETNMYIQHPISGPVKDIIA